VELFVRVRVVVVQRVRVLDVRNEHLLRRQKVPRNGRER
jgi:hypothetical protein